MKRFADIIGNELTKNHLQMAIESKMVSHAYIINGEKGCGKKTLSSLFAKGLLCEKGQKEACGECISCKQFESGNHPDFKWVVPAKNTSIGVEDVREQLVNDIYIKTYSSKYKIYIIDEAQKLTPQAQNAILKTIEEPPAYGIIIFLTTNADMFLPTILSRCVKLDMKPVNKNEIIDYLVNELGVSRYNASFAASFSQGNLGKAIDIVSSQEFNELKDAMLHIMKYIDDMTFDELMSGVKSVSEHKGDINTFLDMVAMWFRDVLIFKSTNDTNMLIFKEDIEFITKQASICSYEGLQEILNGLDKAKARLKANVNFDLTIELLLLTICDYYKKRQ